MGNVIKINEKYAIEKDTACWNLHQYGKGRKKTGEATVTTRTTYHATIEQACTAIIDREAGNCLSVEELKDFFRDAVEALTGHCEGKRVDDGETPPPTTLSEQIYFVRKEDL